MGVPRVLAAAPTGWLAAWLGWAGFFIFCALIAVPGLILLRWVTRLKDRPTSPGSGAPAAHPTKC
jgi:PAT family beta-lactamase induction signal transducer AmpG